MDWNTNRGNILQNATCHTLRGCVDWNILSAFRQSSGIESHPSWVCGLKQNKKNQKQWRKRSHPSWVCGLKLFVMMAKHARYCHTLRGCVDWNLNTETLVTDDDSHTLRGCVDWNLFVVWCLFKCSCHTLRGCVDWNCKFHMRSLNLLVTPFVGVWIETTSAGYRTMI